MALDRAIGEEEGCRDLPVRLALGDKCCHAFLGGCEGAGTRRPAANPLELSASALGPERSADALKNGERLLERCARLAPPLESSLRRAEREQCATALERELDLSMQTERFRIRAKRGLEIDCLRREQPTAPCAVSERRDALQPARVVLIPAEKLGGVLASPEPDERLDVVDDKRDHTRLG